MRMISRRHWSRVHAGHLLARAGFAALPAKVEASLQIGPEQTVGKLLEFRHHSVAYPSPSWLTPDSDFQLRWLLREYTAEERRERRRAMNREYTREVRELRHWWIERMRNSSYPLQEKLTLFWHGHFATSFVKVRSPYALYSQNKMLRSHAAGSWRAMLQAVARDPAMLIYLDNAVSRRRQPNENFAREFMELFTLGEGRYSEEDIREAARAFTGLALDQERTRFAFYEREHDAGEKSFMGKSGHFGADDIIDIILEHKESAHFITRKLATFFMGVEPSELLVDTLAHELRRSEWDLAASLRILFLSEEFYAPYVVRSQIKSPVQWLVGSCQILDRPIPPAAISEMMLLELGQELFAPPNVKGWDGGYAWISTTTLSRRNSFAEWLIEGRNASGMSNSVRRRIEEGAFEPTLADLILPPLARKSLTTATHYFERRFFHAPLPDLERSSFARLAEEKLHTSDNAWSDTSIRSMSLDCMQMPAFQLT